MNHDATRRANTILEGARRTKQRVQITYYWYNVQCRNYQFTHAVLMFVSMTVQDQNTMNDKINVLKLHACTRANPHRWGCVHGKWNASSQKRYRNSTYKAFKHWVLTHSHTRINEGVHDRCSAWSQKQYIRQRHWSIVCLHIYTPASMRVSMTGVVQGP